jgi:16S rRNA (cytidine1402-2'-O)-methyltransferase
VQSRELKGEITLLIGAGEARPSAAETVDLSMRLREIMRDQKLDEKAALKVLAKERGLAKSELYREMQRTKKR